MMNKREDPESLAMRAFIRACRCSGFDEDALVPLGILISQDEVTEKFGGLPQAFTHFSNLVRDGKKQEEVFAIASDMLDQEQ